MERLEAEEERRQMKEAKAEEERKKAVEEEKERKKAEDDTEPEKKKEEKEPEKKKDEVEPEKKKDGDVLEHVLKCVQVVQPNRVPAMRFPWVESGAEDPLGPDIVVESEVEVQYTQEDEGEKFL